MKQEFEHYLFTMEGPLAIVTLNRPDNLNCFSPEAWQEMNRIQDIIEADPGIRVVIINANGPHFSAGIDLKKLAQVDSAYIAANLHWLQRTYNRWQEMSPVILAAIQGVCYGSGFELILACDIRIAAADARFALPEVRFGLSPDMGGSTRLPRLVGPGQAKRLIIACEEIDATEAQNIGLVEIVIPREQLMERTLAMAHRICSQPPWAVRFAKKAINVATEASVQASLLFEQVQSIFCCGTEDQKKAIKDFFTKQKPPRG